MMLSFNEVRNSTKKRPALLEVIFLEGDGLIPALMKFFVKSFAIIIVIILGFFLFVTSQNFFGMRSFIVRSGSMEPTIPTGSLVVTQSVHPSILKTGDVITFVRPAQERDFVTHRVLGISTRNEYISIETKGDNNPVPDNWKVSGGNVIGKVHLTIPWLGYMLAFVQSKIGILLCILIPAIYILVEEISTIIGLVRNNRKSIDTILALLFLGSLSVAGTTTTTQALLSDSVILGPHSFIVQKMPSPTPPKSSCGSATNVTISGNGAGSINTVIVNNKCTSEAEIFQQNNLSIENVVLIQTR